MTKIQKLIARIREPEPGGHPQYDCDLFAAWDDRRIKAALELADLIESQLGLEPTASKRSGIILGED